MKSHAWPKRIFLFVLLPTLVASIARAQVPNGRARDCGCNPNVILLPHYAESGRRTVGCDASFPGPGPSLPEGGVTGYVRFSHVAADDYPGDHQWHDFNYYVAYDPPFQYLNSDTNYQNRNSFLDCIDPIPQACQSVYAESSRYGERLMEIEWDMTYFPERFWPQVGDRVWMFGRYIWDCGHPKGYHNEIHPPTAVAFTRPETNSDLLQRATGPVDKTYVYVHGKSGISCLFDDYLDTSVATRNYNFTIPLPPAPATGTPFAEVVELPYGGPAPSVRISPDKTEVLVEYPLSLGDRSPNRRFGAVIASGWRNATPAISYRNLEVKIQKLRIRKHHGVFCQTDWHLWLNVNGNWSKLQNSFGLLDGTDIKINKTFNISVPDNDRSRLFIQISGWVANIDQLFGSRLGPVDFAAKFPNIFNRIGVEGFEDTTSEGKIGLFFRRYTRSVGDFGVGVPFDEDSNRGDRSDMFREIDLVDEQPANVQSTIGDFELFYTIKNK
jgi:hypothetical protein